MKAPSPIILLAILLGLVTGARGDQADAEAVPPARAATNRTHGFRVSFTAEGPRVTPLRAGSEWIWGLALAGYGYAGEVHPPAPAEVVEAGGRVEYRRGTLTEWYVSDHRGLEQGFTLAAPPGKQGPAELRLELEVEGTMTAYPAGRGDAVAFRDGTVSLRYGGLAAFDSRGREIPARLALEAGRLTIVVDDRGAVYPLTVDPHLTTEAKLTAYDGKAGDSFGRSVTVSGPVVVVGSPLDDDPGPDLGSAYVFRGGGETWALEAHLKASDRAANDAFAFSLALDGEVLVAGAPGDDDNGSGSGSAYVFRFDGAAWVEERKLTPGDGAAGDSFGNGVGISGDVIAVGAHQDDDLGSASGSVYVFRHDGSGWVQEAKLTPSDGRAGDAFGEVVAVDGDTIVVGASAHAHAGVRSGAAYVFRHDGAAWVEEAELTPADGEADDFFARSVAIDMDRVVVGADGDDDHGTLSGAAYLFERSGGMWTQTAKLRAGDAAAGDGFGVSVAVRDDVLLVGASASDALGNNSGAAYVFRLVGTEWFENQKLTASDGQSVDFFGVAVGISGDTMVVGAHFDDDRGFNSGSAYVYVDSGEPHFNPVADAGVDRSLGCDSPDGPLVTLDGSGSKDGDSTPGTNDDIVTFRWFEDHGLPTETSLGEGETLEVRLVAGVHALTLEVTDSEGATDRDDVTLSINAAPAADAGPHVMAGCTALEGGAVTLDGSGSSDGDSTPGTNDALVAFDWFEDYGLPTEAHLGSAETLETTLGLGSHAITLRVTDSCGVSGTDVTVVDVDHLPVAEAGPGVMTGCNALEGGIVALDASGSADGDSTPGTNDALVAFDWFEDFGLPTQTYLGSGETFQALLGLGSHAITLRVTDSCGASDTDPTVATVDYLPVAEGGEDRLLDCTSPAGAATVLDGSGSADADSTPGTNDAIALFEWFTDFGQPTQALVGTGEMLPTMVPFGTHLLTLRTTDTCGAVDTDPLMVQVGIPPTSDPGATSTLEDCTVPEGATVTLDASRSVDPGSPPGTNDTIVDFEWIEQGVPPEQALLGNGERLDVLLSPGTHAVRVAVTDVCGQSDPGIPIDVTVGIAPTADAGHDQAVDCTSPEGAIVTLDGSGSTDPIGVTGHAWYRNFGLPTEVLLGEASTIDVALPPGPHELTLRAADVCGLTSTDRVFVQVDPTAPTGGITAPAPGACSSLPVIVEDDFVDSCDLALSRRYEPPSTGNAQAVWAADGAVADRFGWSVDLDGSLAVIGAYLDDDRGTNSGAAHVFRFDGESWAQEAKLTADDGYLFDFFGFDVAVSGDVVVVGAYGDDDGGAFSSGSVYVFRHDGTAWVQEQKLTASDAASGDFFGFAVDVDGDRIVVGARLDDDLGFSSGSAYVFRFDGSAWLEETKLTASDGAAADIFGNDVSIDGDRILVGAYLDDDRGSSSGSAYVFRLDGATWSEEAKLTAADGHAGEFFGFSVSLAGDTAVVGAYQDNERGSASGSAYAFRRSGATWSQEAKLLPAGPSAPGDAFGYAVDVDGDTALVGSPGDDDPLFGAGSATVFRRTGGSWNEVAVLGDADAEPSDAFGVSVAQRGETALVGVYAGDGAAQDSGSAVFIAGTEPAYKEHGDTTVVLTVTDDGGNSASDSVSFTVDRVAPTVAILAGVPDVLIVPSSLPFAALFLAADDDGAGGGPVLEQVFLEDCLVFDGATYGDGDGLLRDEQMELDLVTGCEAVSRCGLGGLEAVELRVDAADCGGNVGSASTMVSLDPLVAARCQPVLSVTGVAGAAGLAWEPSFPADDYDVIRGDVADLRLLPDAVDLGTVTCLAEDTPVTAEIDPELPEPGRAFFYLVRYRYLGSPSPYGFSSERRAGRPGGGGCQP